MNKNLIGNNEKNHGKSLSKNKFKLQIKSKSKSNNKSKSNSKVKDQNKSKLEKLKYTFTIDLKNYNEDQTRSSGPNPNTIIDMFNSSKSSKSSKGKNNEKNKKLENIPNNIILWQGWLKFISYTDQNIKPIMTPNKFYINPEYNYQRILKKDLKKKDKIGYINVRSKFLFFAMLKSNSIYIFKNRKSAIGKIVEEIKISEIKDIDLNNIYLSSIREIEDFQNNFCLKIKTNLNSANKKNQNQNQNKNQNKDQNKDYILCFERKSNRNKLIKFLVTLKLFQQKKVERTRRQKNLMSPDNFLKKKTKTIDRPKHWLPKDGYWILLQDWTTCSLKCGGGLSYQQWMCVPPKKGGRKCIGKPVRTRPCNSQPCPITKTIDFTKNKVLTPIIKSMPFSLRPQNYIKCHIKENDVFYMLNINNGNESENKSFKRPARLVMNTHTITVFNDDNYKDVVFSFNLLKTSFAENKSDKCCFDLINGKYNYTICGSFGQPCKGRNFVFEWKKDFNYFKFDCYKILKEQLYKKATIKKALKKAVNDAGLGAISDRIKLIKKNVDARQIDQWNLKIQKTENNSFKVIKKEIDIEKMLQRELQLKAELESKQLLDLKKREQRKKECLEKAIKTREIMNKNLLEKIHRQQKINAIKLSTKKEVQNQRTKLKEKLMEIRNKYKRRKRLIEQDINVIRAEMTKDIMVSNRVGDMLICKNSMSDTKKIKYYCNKEFVDDFIKNEECKSKSSFCYVCCENEFGGMVMDKRAICYKMCDMIVKDTLDDGDFYWV
jgi:hypothetical protein